MLMTNKLIKSEIVQQKSERGAAMIVALIVIAAFIVIASAASKTVSAISAEAERYEQTRKEAARAEYYVSLAEATLKYDVRRLYNDYQLRGKQRELQLGGSGTLPFFDPLTVTDSRPLLNLDGSDSGAKIDEATSLYGVSAPWVEEALSVCRTYIDTKTAEKQINAPETVQIKSFTEAYRRTMAGESEPIYAFRYTVRATSGEYAEVVKDDVILLGPVLNDDSPVIANCSDLALTGLANPANVIWGNPTRLQLNYTRSERVVIYNQGGAVVYDQVVPVDATPQSITYDTAPLTAPTVFIAEAVRGTCQIQVPITVGVTFAQNIAYTVNGVQSVNIIEGENVRYDWNVTDADANYTSSYITYGSDPAQFFNNVFNNSLNQPGPLVSTTSVLHVRDTRYNNNAEQTATINITVCRLSRVLNFTVTPSPVTAGNNSDIRFEWQTEQAAQIRIIRISDGQIIHTSNNAASGNWTTVQPQVTTDYRIEAVSNCGAPLASQTIRVNVTNSPCQGPQITNFNVNPTQVSAGGNQTVRFAWNVVGNYDSLSINNNVGNNLPATGTIDFPQPQTTTNYTITAERSGCGQDTKTVVVTVSGTPTNEFVNVSKFENLHYYDVSGLVTYYPLKNYSSNVTYNEDIAGSGYHFSYRINRALNQFSVKFYYNGPDYNTFLARNELIFKVVSPTSSYPTSPYLFNVWAMPSANPRNDGTIPCYWDEVSAPDNYYHARYSSTNGTTTFLAGLTNPRVPTSPVACIAPNSDSAPSPSAFNSSNIQVRELSPSQYGRVFEYYGTYEGTTDPVLMLWQKRLPYMDCSEYGCIPVAGETTYKYYNSNMIGTSLFADCLYLDAGAGVSCNIDGIVMKK